MASKAIVNELSQIIEQLKKIDLNKVTRPSLGDLAVKEAEPFLQNILDKAELALLYGEYVSDSNLGHIKSTFHNIYNYLNNVSGFDHNKFVNARQEILHNLNKHLNELENSWPPLVTAAVEKEGILNSSSFQKLKADLLTTIQKESEEAVSKIQKEAEKKINQAKSVAGKIESSARDTAKEVSLAAAQEQFKIARREQANQIWVWSIISVAFSIAFISTALYFLTEDPDPTVPWLLFYKVAIRLAILTGIGAFATISIKLLRAHLHMYQHNLHRQKITNSIPAFVEAASTPEQRDMILSKLVDSVCSFGNSGIITQDDQSTSPSLTIDNITRTFSAATKSST